MCINELTEELIDQVVNSNTHASSGVLLKTQLMAAGINIESPLLPTPPEHMAPPSPIKQIKAKATTRAVGASWHKSNPKNFLDFVMEQLDNQKQGLSFFNKNPLNQVKGSKKHNQIANFGRKHLGALAHFAHSSFEHKE